MPKKASAKVIFCPRAHAVPFVISVCSAQTRGPGRSLTQLDRAAGSGLRAGSDIWNRGPPPNGKTSRSGPAFEIKEYSRPLFPFLTNEIKHGGGGQNCMIPLKRSEALMLSSLWAFPVLQAA